jgi:hypothetical protein
MTLPTLLEWALTRMEHGFAQCEGGLARVYLFDEVTSFVVLSALQVGLQQSQVLAHVASFPRSAPPL